MENSKKIFLIIFLGFFSISLAQENIEMITDRPDATESPNTVPLKSLQIETGVFFDSYSENEYKFETIGYNTTLLRYGLLSNFELRLGWNFEESRTFVNNEQLDNVESGFSPLLLGMKVEIIEEKGWKPEIGLIGHLNLPFLASTDYRPETTGADFRFSFSHTLSKKSSIAYNLGAEWGNDSSEISYIYTWAYGYKISEKIGAYAELYGDFPEDNRANHYWDAGFTYLIKNNFQIDATIGRSFTEGQDLLVSAGVSFRIPK